jgi:hypothetical protein
VVMMCSEVIFLLHRLWERIAQVDSWFNWPTFNIAWRLRAFPAVTIVWQGRAAAA